MAINPYPPDDPVQSAPELVTKKFNLMEAYTLTQSENLDSFIVDLDNYLASVTAPVIDVDGYVWDDIKTSSIMPARPSRPNMDIGSPLKPEEPDLDFTQADKLADGWRDEPLPVNNSVYPTIEFPDKPDITWPTDPGDPPSLSDQVIADEPDYDDAVAPTITEVTVGDIPSIVQPSLSIIHPEFSEVVSLHSFDHTVDEYKSELAELIKAKLKNDVENGGTGLGTAIEDQIWDNAVESLQEVHEQQQQEVLTFWAGRGFEFPPGALSGALAMVAQQQAKGKEQLNRDIAIEQARLADQNTRWANDAGITFENYLMNHHDAIASLSLDAAKHAQQSAIDTYKIRVMFYEAKLAGINSEIAAFESQLKANDAILQEFRLKIEAAKGNVEIQALYVQIYETFQRGNAIKADIFRTSVEAAKIKAELEEKKLEAHKLKVDIFTATTNANTARYGAYAAEINGEAEKIKLYSESNRAYLAEVEAVKVKKDITIATVAAELDANRAKIEEYRAQLESYEKDVDFEISKITANSDIFKADITAYNADIEKARAQILGDIETYRAKAEHERGNLQIALEESRVNAQNKMEEFRMRIQALESKVLVANQMTASALSAVSASASMSYGRSASESKSMSTSQGKSFSLSPETLTEIDFDNYTPA